ncbi:toxin-antitoxin system YwqK family antitoxin [Shewanella ulleungensis]|nr:toxin-antitoxin system YwqK family antitoxin [Shewanella ulleungensis]MCL1152332.1 toxin-antitoxin system YwqK family antitoxin [Shewanella ulleungensis]
MLSVKALLVILGSILLAGLSYGHFFMVKAGPVASQHISISPTTGLRMYQNSPFTGDAVTFYPNGQMAKLAHFEQGLRDGFLRQWFENGTLAFDSHYVFGVLEGITRSWWSNGNMRSESVYHQGKVNGTSLQWYATGERFKKMNYVDGVEAGLQQAWRRNGKLFSNYQYINGRVFGLKRSNMCVGLENEEVVESD